MTKFVPFTGGLNYTARTSYEGVLGIDIMPTADLMEWCDERFEGHYTNTLMLGSGAILWMFEKRKEAIWFTLTWA